MTMKLSLGIFAVSVSVSLASALVWVGCGGDVGAAAPASSNGAPAAEAGVSPACPACITDQDCKGGVCAQLGGDSYCAPVCPNGNECPADRACVAVTTVKGDQASACVPRGADVCSATGADQDAAVPTDTCGTLVGPNVKAGCPTCVGKPNCQANGCFGGWWCNTANNRCQSPPPSCAAGGSDAGGGGGGVPFDGGGPVTGQVGANGGSLSRLLFAVVGDTRPASIDDTAGYPSPIIDKIYTDIEALGAKPPMVVATGDYNFASTSGTQAETQLGLYLAARSKYSGVLFPAMGNHECTGATASNCGPGSMNGATPNYDAFLSKLLGPIAQTAPYYAIHVNALDSSWTAKFVFIAANAWSPEQATWLETTLSQNTTYTFIVRHESKQATQAPGVAPSETIMAAHPYTLSIVGHSHTYQHYAGREVLIGNGGAPLTGGKNYGFGIFSQRPDGAIQVDVVDYASGLADGAFRFAAKPDGSPAP